MVGGGELEALAERAAGVSDPREALRAVAELRTRIEGLELDNVERAIEEGCSWGAIAESLGISKQAAHKRYAKRLRERAARAAGRRNGQPREQVVITAAARRAVRAGQIAALALGHAEVEGAHLLLGLLADLDGPAARALTAIGVDFDAARDRVADLDLPRTRLGSRELNARVAGRIPISAPARAALERSLDEVARLGHRHLGVEHLLLSLLRDERGTAVTTLSALGVAADDLERCLGKVLMDASFERAG